MVPLRQRNGKAVPGAEVAGDGLALMLSNFIMRETSLAETNWQNVMTIAGHSGVVAKDGEARFFRIGDRATNVDTAAEPTDQRD